MISKRIARIAVLAATVGGLQVTAAVPADAQEVPPFVGRRCSFASVTDPTVEAGDVQTGQINAGPLVSTTPGSTVAITCTIQVGAANMYHSGADACSVTGPATPQVAILPPTLCSYVSPDGQPVWMCTHVRKDGVSYYYDAATGTWSTNPNTATCQGAISIEIPPPVVWDTIRTVGEEVDKVVCPVLVANAGVHGPVYIAPDGDVYIDDDGNGSWEKPENWWWDCPPYTDV